MRKCGWYKHGISSFADDHQIPANRFDLKSHYDETGQRNNTTLTPYGSFLYKLLDQRQR